MSIDIDKMIVFFLERLTYLEQELITTNDVNFIYSYPYYRDNTLSNYLYWVKRKKVYDYFILKKRKYIAEHKWIKLCILLKIVENSLIFV